MFTVIWLSRALNQLADVYVRLDLSQQRQLAAAIEVFNHRLQTQPLAEGESRGGDL